MIAQVRENEPQYSLNELLMTFDVSKSGYRHHFSAKKTRAKARKLTLVAGMKTIRRDKKLRSYGSPRMTAELRARGHEVSENTVAHLMRENGMRASKAKPYKPPKTTTRDPQAKYSPNLLEAQEAQSFCEVLVADICQLPYETIWLPISASLRFLHPH